MNKHSELGWLLKKIRTRLPALILVTAIGAVNAYLGVRFALESQCVIDSISIGQEAFRDACIRLGTVSVLLVICYAANRHFREQTVILLDADWKKQLTHVLLNAEYKKTSAYHSGELINRMNNDVRVIDEVLVAVFPGVISMAIRAIAAVYALVRYEPRFTVIILFAGSLMALISVYMKRIVKGLHKSVSEENGRVLGFIQEIMENMLVIQAMDMTDEAERRVGALLHKRWSVQKKLKNMTMIGNSSVICACYVAEFAAVFFCSSQLMSQAMTLGTMTAIIQLVSQLEGPFINFSGFLSQTVSAFASVERLMELNIMDQDLPDALDSDEVYREMNAIELQKVTFGYGERVIMDSVSLCIPKGSFVAVTGVSGAGKSTLLKLLTGIYEIDSGRIALSTALGTIPLDRRCRKMFAYVPQGNLLLSGTLKENLLMVAPKANEYRLRRALEISCLDSVVDQLPDGMDTLLGESGMGLSEGQAQRLSIARAILKDAPILLLDEATSALDAEMEKHVLNNISQIPDRTCIFVTHRPAALELADTVIHVHDGTMTCERKSAALKY